MEVSTGSNEFQGQWSRLRNISLAEGESTIFAQSVEDHYIQLILCDIIIYSVSMFQWHVSNGIADIVVTVFLTVSME